MTTPRAIGSARIADLLSRFMGRTIITRSAAGELVGHRPSMRELERLSGVPHQRISEFLRNPERATDAAARRMESIVNNPALAFDYQGARVTYRDAPAFGVERLRGQTAPDGARAYRFVVETDEERYKGFRSSEWIGDFDRMAEIAETVPGGIDAIIRIVYDTGD